MSSPHAAVRIIDANLNRAREALRVMEEYARLALDDGDLSAAIKRTRHELAESVPDAIAREVTASRDIVGDVGRRVCAPDEYERLDAAAVVVAAGKRLSEALRAVEEYAKTIDPGFAVAVERLRYTGYELERRIAATCRACERFGGARLYVLLTEALCAGGWLATAEAALRGGADCLQLREKELSDDELVTRAKQLATLCRSRDALFIVNDRPDVAVLSNAHGVHIGQDDLSVAQVRRILPPTMLVGLSTHTVEQVEAAAAVAPDYIAVGPVFTTPNKPGDAVGAALLREAGKRTSLPLVAIGGINCDNAREVLNAADCCLGVCGAVISEPDVATAAAKLRKMSEGPQTP